jgi:hypothetical protein
MCSIRSVNEALAFPTAASIARDTGEVIVGCGFVRDPPDATPRYTAWLNRVCRGNRRTAGVWG